MQKVIMQWPLLPRFPYALFSGVQYLSFTGGYTHSTFVHPGIICSLCMVSEGSRCCREDLAPSAQLWRVPRAAEPSAKGSWIWRYWNTGMFSSSLPCLLLSQGDPHSGYTAGLKAEWNLIYDSAKACSENHFLSSSYDVDLLLNQCFMAAVSLLSLCNLAWNSYWMRLCHFSDGLCVYVISKQ